MNDINKNDSKEMKTPNINMVELDDDALEMVTGGKTNASIDFGHNANIFLVKE